MPLKNVYKSFASNKLYLLFPITSNNCALLFMHKLFLSIKDKAESPLKFLLMTCQKENSKNIRPTKDILCNVPDAITFYKDLTLTILYVSGNNFLKPQTGFLKGSVFEALGNHTSFFKFGNEIL